MKSSSSVLGLIVLVLNAGAGYSQKMYPVVKRDAIENLKDRLTRQAEIIAKISSNYFTENQVLSSRSKTRPKWTSDVDCHALEDFIRSQQCEKSEVTTNQPHDCQTIDYLTEQPEWIKPELFDNWNESKVNPYDFDVEHFKDTVALTLYCEEEHSGWSIPLNYTKTNSKFGQRRRRWHHGMDLDLEVGDPIYASFDGVVRVSSYIRRGYGKYIVIRHKNGLETVYGHLSEQFVRPGDVVKAGDLIGLGGNTGRSTGPHLHFETRYQGQSINPELIFDFDNERIREREFLITPSLCQKKIQYTNRRSGKTARKTKPTRVTNSKSIPSVHQSEKNTSQPTSTVPNPVEISPSAKKTTVRFHTVRQGDTLSEIAQRYGLTVDRLCALNGLGRNSKLILGRKLRLS